MKFATRALLGVLYLSTFVLAQSSRARADTSPTTSIVALSPARTTGYVGASGTAVEGVPLLVPPGRKQFQPSLSLLYSSLGGEGELGLGWGIETGKIERSPAYGIPAGALPDEFDFALGGGDVETLVPLGAGSYRPRFESAYRQYQFLTDHWQVTDSAGTVYSFGSSVSSRIDGLSWALDRIQDTNGNLVTFTYANDGGYLIPSSINYTGNAFTNEQGANTITFEYQPRPDTTTANSLGPTQTRQMRLWRISETAGGALVRRYLMTYAPSASSGRSLLSEVDVVGDDDTSSMTLRRYTYQSQPAGYQSNASNGIFPVLSYDSAGKDLGTRNADVNADGFIDVVDNGSHVWLNDQQGNFIEDPAWSSSFSALGVSFIDGSGADTGTRLIDINGDLRPDIVVSNGNAQRVFINNGTGWETDATSAAYQQSLTAIKETGTTEAQYLGVSCDAGADAEPCDTPVSYTESFQIVGAQGNSNGVSLADVNGDGLVDIVWSFENSSVLYNYATDAGPFAGLNFNDYVPVTIHGVWLNTGSGFSRSDSYSNSLAQIPPFVIDTQLQGFDVFDVNGDGIADVVNTHTPSGASDPRGVWLGSASVSAGYAFTGSSTYTAGLVSSGGDLASFDGDNALGLAPEDYNHDGLMDYVRASPSATVAYRNTGTGWAIDAAETAILQAAGVVLADGSGKPGGYGFVDLDGDGNDDLVIYRDGVGNSARLGLGPTADLLQQTTTLLGETASLAYAPCNRFSSLGADGLYHLPMAFAVVTSLTRSDGVSSSFPSTVTYKGGVAAARQGQAARFRSFAASTETDSRGVRTSTSFSTEEALAGIVLSTTTFDTSGVARELDTVTYNEVAAAPGVTQIQVVATDQERFDPGGTTHTRVRDSYDAFLNVVELDKDGDISVAGDEGRTVFTFTQNPSVGIFSAVATVSVYEANGGLHSQSTMLYDGNATAGSITQGNVTSIVDYVGPSVPEVTRRYNYDSYGNPVLLSDRNGGVSTFTYDAATHTFVTSSMDAMARTASSVVDARFGTATRQVDPNGNALTRTYDAFGRLVTETLPGDEASPSGTHSYVYSALGAAGAQSVTIRSTVAPGSAATLDSTATLDGFGQQTRVVSPGDGGQSVSIVTTYDDVGNIATQSAPYSPSGTPVFASTQRDALRRVISATDLRGVTTTTVYRGSSRDVIDGRGNTTTYNSDAYGHDVAVYQSVGGQQYSTFTTYNVVGNRVAVTDAAGDVTAIAYDGLERRTALSEPNIGSFTYAYDPNGNLTTQSGPTGVFHFTYDADNEILSKAAPHAKTVKYTYGNAAANGVGKVTHIVDDAGTLDAAYDPRGRVISKTRTINGACYTTQYTFDSLDRTTSVTYPDGFVANYSFGAAGLVSSIADGQGRPIVQSLGYDADGKPISLAFGNGVSTTYARDVADQMTSFKTVNAAGKALQDRTLAYDAVGNVASITDSLRPKLSQTFTYDEINRIADAKGGYGEQVFEYDSVGNLVRKGNLLFQRDPTNHQQMTCAIDLNLAAQPLNGLGAMPNLLACAKSLGSSGTVSATEQSALQTIVARAGFVPSIGQSMAMAYDAAGNMVGRGALRMAYDAENHLVGVGESSPLGDELGGGGASPIESNVYAFDGGRVLRQLATGDGVTYIDGLWELELDPADWGVEHVRRQIQIGKTIVATVTEDGVNAIHADLSPSAVRSSGGGRTGSLRTLLAKATNVGGRSGAGLSALLLVAVSFGLMTTAFGRQARRRWSRALGQSIALAPRRPFKYAVSMALVAIQILQLSPATVPEARADGYYSNVHTYYYHLDHVGNTNVITDDNGNVFEVREYDPFGAQFIRNGALLETSLNAHEFDPATDLYYFGARHYDPLIGRFVTADTQVNNDTPAGLHRYAFNANNPIRFADYTGHDFWDVLTGVLAGILVVVGVVLAVVTYGAATPLSVVLFGAAIGLVTAGVTLAVAYYGFYQAGKISLGDVIALTFAAFIIGACTGAAGAAAIAGAYTAGAASSLTLTADVALGAATGSVAAGAEAAISKASPEKFLLAVFSGAVIGGLTGLGSYFVGVATLPLDVAPGTATTVDLSTVAGLQAVAQLQVNAAVWATGTSVLLWLNIGVSGLTGWFVASAEPDPKKKATPRGTPQESVGTNAMNPYPAMQ